MSEPATQDALHQLLAEQAEELAALRLGIQALDERHRRIAELALRPRAAEAVQTAPLAPVAITLPNESAPASPAATDAVSALCDHLEGMERRFAQHGLGLDPTDAAFLGRVRPVLAQAGAALSDRLVDVCTFCDRLGAPLLGAVWRPVHAELQQARHLLLAALPGWRLVQSRAVDPSVTTVRLPVAESLILAVGLIDAQGQIRLAAAAAVPAATPTPEQRLAWALAEELHGILRQAFRKPLKDDLRHLAETIARSELNSEDLRACLNIHTRWCERADSPAARACLDQLRVAGLRPFAIENGERFDPDRHDLKRFDRVVRSGGSQAPGTVVGLRQLGLADERGLPIQKCIALVSA